MQEWFNLRWNLGRRDHVPIFTFKLLLDASVEEERDVGVLLGLYSKQDEPAFYDGKTDE